MTAEERAALEARLARTEAELARLRSGYAYRMAITARDALGSPRRAARLPLDLARLLMEARRTARMQRRPVDRLPETIGRGAGVAPILFCPTNGVGLGHFSRCLAVARRIRARAPEVPVIFLVSTPLVHAARGEGFATYYIPPKADVVESAGSGFYDRLLFRSIADLLAAYRPGIVVYDGLAPYQPFLDALAEAPFAAPVWIKRGLVPPELDAEARKAVPHFRLVIEPGEAGAAPRGPLPAPSHAVAPIVSIMPGETLSRAEARHRLAIPEHATAVYLQLGAGVRHDNTAIVTRLLARLNAREDVIVCLAQSPLNPKPVTPGPRTRLIRDYPNAPLFSAFDAAVSAAGYNTFHELMVAGVPTLFVPREPTPQESDDQIARAELARDAGAAIVVREAWPDPELEAAIDAALERLLDPEARRPLARAAAALGAALTGADEAAEAILALHAGKATAEAGAAA